MESFKLSLVVLAVCYCLVSAVGGQKGGGGPKTNGTMTNGTMTNGTWGQGFFNGSTPFPENDTSGGRGWYGMDWRDFFDMGMQDEFNDFLLQALDDATMDPGTTEFCPYGMVWCTEQWRCVPVVCDEMEQKCGDWNNWCQDMCGDWNNWCQDKCADYSIEDFRQSLRDEIQNVQESKETEYCPYGQTFCFQTGSCVPVACTINVESFGSCPAEAMDLCADDAESECDSDANCRGLTSKCCRTACGGSVCASPDLSALDPDDITIKPYLVTRWKTSLEPAGVAVNDFIKNADTGYVKFGVATARGPCDWKYASGFNIVTEGDAQVQVPVWADITADLKVDIDALVTCIPASLSVHGFAVINVTQFDSNDAEVGSHTFAGLLLPARIAPDIALEGADSSVTQGALEFLEDETVEVNLPIEVSYAMEFNIPEVTIEDQLGMLGSNAGKLMFAEYERQLAVARELSESLGFYLGYRTIPASLDEVAGDLMLAKEDDPREFVDVSYKTGAFAKFTQRMIFKPKRDYSGSFIIEARAWNGLARIKEAPFVSDRAIVFNVTVLNVNDAPQMRNETLKNLDFNPREAKITLEIPLNLADNVELLVSDIIRDYYEDPETDTLGMCVLRAQQSALGGFKYKPAGGNSWVTVDVAEVGQNFQTGQFSPFAPSKFAEIAGLRSYAQLLKAIHEEQPVAQNAARLMFQSTCLLLKPDTLIKYEPATGDAFWDWGSDTQFAFTAWDSMADEVNNEGDLVNYTLPFCTECASSDSPLAVGYVTGEVMRIGCTGRVSTVRLVDDVCGVCGGDNSSCTDCAGVLHGDALMNRCGHCVGGTTGKNVTFGFDCNNRCSVNQVKIFSELGGECLPIDTDSTAIISQLFCDGVWKSGARINRCGVCVGGTTGLGADEGRDECGICGGDNSTCADCEGTPNGGKRIDGCGVCLSPDDSTFGTGCVAISDFEPLVVNENTEGQITMYGAGLDQFLDDPRCYMISANAEYNFTVTGFFSFRNTIRGVYPSLPAGQYDVRCVFMNAQGTGEVPLTVDGKKFTYISAPTLTSITPNTAALGAIPEEVYVVGSGFADTGYVKCVFVCPMVFTAACRRGPVQLDAEVKNATHVRCIIPSSVSSRIRSGVNLNISVALTDVSLVSISEIKQYPHVVFSLTSPAPEISSAWFEGGCILVIEFTETIEFEGGDCSAGLDNTAVAKLGTNYECRTIGTRVLYILGANPTLRAGDSVTLSANKIKQIGAENADYATGSVAVGAPSRPSVFFAGFRAPSLIGSCDKQKIRATFQGSKCGIDSLQFKWNVSYTGANLANVSANLENVGNRLASISSSELEIGEDEIIPGEMYRFEVYVIDHLGISSSVEMTEITRDQGVKPLLVDIGGDREGWNPDRDLVIRSKVQISECVNVSLNNLDFRWSADGVTDFNFDIYSSSFAKVLGGSMKGGKTYDIKLTVSSPSDASVSAEASLTIVTRSQPMIAYIRRSPRIITGVEQKFTLDASLSRDPDRSDDDTFYLWSCTKLDTQTNGDVEEQPCYLDLWGSIAKFEASNLTGDGRQPVVDIPGAALTSGEYRFDLMIVKGERNMTTSIVVQVEEGTPPQIFIEPIRGTVVSSRVLSINAFIASPLAFTASWRVDVQQGYDEFELTDGIDRFQYEVKTAADKYPAPLVVPSGLKQGAKYKFILEAEHDDSSSFAEIDFTVNAPPQNCFLELSRTDGAALSDEFEVTVSGCEDDEDDFPLKFIFSVKDVETNNIVQLTTSASADNVFSGKLAKGKQTYIAKICDQKRGCIDVESDQLNVTAAVLTTEKIDGLKVEIEQERILGGGSNIAKNFVQDVLSGSSDTATDEQLLAALDVARDEGTNQVAKANPDDSENAHEVLAAASAMFNKAGNVSTSDQQTQAAMEPATGSQMNEANSQATINAIRGSSTGGSTQTARRKRATEEETVSAIDISSAESIMTTAVTSTKDILEADLTQADANSFFDTLEAVWQGLCAGIVSGQDALVGYTDTTVFRAYSTPFEGLNETDMLASCTGCDQYVDTPAQFTLGSEIVSTYTEWTCDTDATCYGGCLASGQISQDLITAKTTKIEPLSSSRLSDIVAIHLINPTTAGYVTLLDLTSPIAFNLILNGVPDTATYKYMCRAWNTTDLDWTDDACGEAVLTNITNTEWKATCMCNQLGYFAVFEGDELLDQTALLETTINPELAASEATTTNYNSANTTNYNGNTTIYIGTTNIETVTNASTATATDTTEPPFYYDDPDMTAVTIQIKIDADFSLVSGGNESTIIAEIRPQLANIMSVNESQITNIELSQGSILVKFDLVSDGLTASEMSAAIQSLQAFTNNAAATFTVNGNSYSSVAGFFSAEPIVPEVPKAAPEGLGMGAIIGLAVGSVLLVILIIVAIAILCYLKKKTKSNKISHSPATSRLEVGLESQKRTEVGSHTRKDAELPGSSHIPAHQTSPDDEAMYGKPPTPVLAENHPISSRAENRSLTPVGP